MNMLLSISKLPLVALIAPPLLAKAFCLLAMKVEFLITVVPCEFIAAPTPLPA